MVDFKKLSRRMRPNGYRYFSDLALAGPEYEYLPKKYLVLDTETTGTKLFHGCQAFAIAAVDNFGKRFYWRFKVHPKTRTVSLTAKDRKEVLELARGYGHYVFHNGKFDIRALRTIGIDLLTLPDFWKGFRDTLFYSHACDSTEKHELKPLALKYLGVSMDDETALKEKVKKLRRQAETLGYSCGENVEEDYCFAGDELDAYAMNDVVARTLPLFQMYVEVVRELRLGSQVAREHFLTPHVFGMEERGVYVRKKTLLTEKARYESLVVSSSREATTVAVSNGMPKDFNLNSGQQLQVLLFDKLKLPVIKHTAGTDPKKNRSTDADVIEELLTSKKTPEKAKRFLTSYALYKKAGKALETLVKWENLVIRHGVTTCLHGSLNQTGTRLTRFSSSDPNQQNISKDKELEWVEKGIRSLRCVLGPRPGHYWIDCDYDNIEMRLLAWASGEKRLQELFLKGESYHLLIAEILHGPKDKWKNVIDGKWKDSPEYKTTKNGNFARGYGAGEAKTDDTYGVPGAYQKLKGEFLQWSKYNSDRIKQAQDEGYVSSLFGYRLTVPHEYAFTMALNSVIQGSAGCAMKYGMLAVAEDEDIRNLRGEMVLTVHDQLIVEFPNSSNPLTAANAVKRAMESPGVYLGIPLTVSPAIVRSDWTKAQDIETTFTSKFF